MICRLRPVMLAPLITLGLAIIAPIALADSLLNGLATHKELNKEQFIGALYSDNLSSDAAVLFNSSGAKRMELRVITKRLSSRRLNSIWIEGMAINNPTNLLTSQAENMVSFTTFVKRSLKAGDILSIRGENATTTVTLNGILLGTIESEYFFDMVLRTWVGSVPLSSEFRDNLLTNGEIDSAVLAQYESLQPSDARRQTIVKWTQPETLETASAATPVKPAAASLAPAALAPTVIAAKPQVAAPTLASKPQLVKPAPASTATLAVASEPAKADIEPPQATSPTPEAPVPLPEAANDAALLAEEEFADDDDFEEDNGPLLTAESLLSRQIYHSELLKWTYKYIRYPKRAANRGQEGSVRVAVVIDREGNVKNVSEVEQSKYSSLNKEAMGAVKRAVPFPSMPDNIEGEEFSFSLPIVFKLPK